MNRAPAPSCGRCATSAPAMRVTPERARALNAPLASARLALEPLTAAHAEALFAPLQHAAIYAWISSQPPSTVAALRERWAGLEGRLSPDGEEAWLNWALRRAGDGAFVGRVDVSVSAGDVATNVGYVLFPAHWGAGYATEAVRAVVVHLEGCGVRELRATVTVGNDASCRVLARCGFRRTGVLRGNDTIRGVLVDDVAFVRGG